jgi:4-hydroxythreonine-4-phosphate dehydrogenase
VSAAGTRKPLVLTLGEPAGIGPDITIEAWLQRRALRLPPFMVMGDGGVLVRRAAALGREIRVTSIAPSDAATAFDDALPCVRNAPAVIGTPGSINPSDTPAVIDSIRRSVELVRAGEASAVVTNPIHKRALSDAGFPFPGHTEFLAELGKELYGLPAAPVMMLVGADLRVVPVTVHIPLAAVPRALTTALIVQTGETVARELKSRFGIDRPRIAVAGLNPHAGEDGTLGHEDEAIVRPAVEALRGAGIDATGPVSADTLFRAEARKSYDAVLCMYHDQALIPLKTLAFDEGVNVTLGLPFVRTSPDHGTALPLAGTGRARMTSLIAALRLADELSRREIPA